MPAEHDLPEDICGLTRRNAAFVHLRTAEADIQRIIRKLRLNETPGETPSKPAPAMSRSAEARSEPPPTTSVTRSPPGPSTERAVVVSKPKPSFPLPEMVRIEAGSFMMGSAPDESGAFRDEYPRHEVHIPRPFELGR